jgi:hypothetical protein
MARKKYDAVATVGTYRNAAGEEKKRYSKIGVVFEDEAGRLSLKLDTIPVGPDWSGWVSLYEPEVSQGEAPQSRQPAHTTQRQAPTARTAVPAYDYDDNPF